MPDDRIAAFSPRTGAATKADAVSWLPTRCTSASMPWWASTGPSVVPASTGSPANGASGSSSRSISPRAHVPARASSRPVVEALVISLTSSPVSQYDSRSGTSAIRSATAVRSSARSWKAVLIGIVWMPVTAYSSLAGTRACARATIPSVRASR